MENFDHILLFKTNISCEADKAAVCAMLSNFNGVEQLTLDLEDEDRVLRIVSATLNHQQIINLINQHGYTCCELI
jgi:copper chaperone CopZ